MDEKQINVWLTKLNTARKILDAVSEEIGNALPEHAAHDNHISRRLRGTADCAYRGMTDDAIIHIGHALKLAKGDK